MRGDGEADLGHGESRADDLAAQHLALDVGRVDRERRQGQPPFVAELGDLRRHGVDHGADPLVPIGIDRLHDLAQGVERDAGSAIDQPLQGSGADLADL